MLVRLAAAAAVGRRAARPRPEPVGAPAGRAGSTARRVLVDRHPSPPRLGRRGAARRSGATADRLARRRLRRPMRRSSSATSTPSRPSRPYARMRAAGFRSAYAEANGAEPAVTWPSGLQAPGMDTDGEPGCLDYIWVRGAVRGASRTPRVRSAGGRRPDALPERSPRARRRSSGDRGGRLSLARAPARPPRRLAARAREHDRRAPRRARRPGLRRPRVRCPASRVMACRSSSTTRRSTASRASPGGSPTLGPDELAAPRRARRSRRCWRPSRAERSSTWS